MKNNNLPIHSLLKCLMLMTFGLFVVQGLSAKTFQKIYMFTYFEYDNTTGMICFLLALAQQAQALRAVLLP